MKTPTRKAPMIRTPPKRIPKFAERGIWYIVYVVCSQGPVVPEPPAASASTGILVSSRRAPLDCHTIHIYEVPLKGFGVI